MHENSTNRYLLAKRKLDQGESTSEKKNVVCITIKDESFPDQIFSNLPILNVLDINTCSNCKVLVCKRETFVWWRVISLCDISCSSSSSSLSRMYKSCLARSSSSSSWYIRFNRPITSRAQPFRALDWKENHFSQDLMIDPVFMLHAKISEIFGKKQIWDKKNLPVNKSNCIHIK